MSPRIYTAVVHDVAELLGAQVREGRLERRWSMADLAERAGVSEKTVRNVERGELGVAIGIVLDCALLCGVTLFYDDERRTAAEAARGRAALIGKRVRRAPAAEIDLDF